MRKMIQLGGLLLVTMCLAVSVQAQKFGYVNSAAILAEMPEVKQADANLEALQKQLQKKGQGMVEKLQTDFQALQQRIERGELSRVQQEEEAKKLKDEEGKIAKFEQDMVQQIQKKRNELLEPIYKKVNDAIASVAKEGSYQFIFDQTILLYATEAQDVSAQVKTKLGI